MKALVGAFNQEKALVGAFSVIVKTGCGTDGSFYSTIRYAAAAQTQTLRISARHCLVTADSSKYCTRSQFPMQLNTLMIELGLPARQ